MQNDKLYNEIIHVVCDYYGVRRYDVLVSYDGPNFRGKHNRARCVSIYFIRMFTGDAFKIINIFFGFTYPTGAQARQNHVAHRYLYDASYQKEVDEIYKLIEEKINLVVT